MKAKIFTVITFLAITISNAQNLNIKFLEQIADISFVEIDDIMEDGYGYKLVQEDKDGEGRMYIKVPNKDWNSAIMVQIFPTSKPRFTIEIKVGKNYDLQNLKEAVVDNGYLYQGLNKYDFFFYKKDDLNFLISNIPNLKGYRQILFLPDE